ncbi:MAG TPA: hypothetical protein VGB73_11415 [Pyrinomonadaceae bacterium]|jgi:hypothetical protein
MKEDDDSESQRAIIQEISEALTRCGDEATAGFPAGEVARTWLDAGFDDAEEVEDWLRARCFSPDGALALDRAGITPEQAALRTTAGTAPYEDTIGYKLTQGHLSFDEARRLINSAFWNA